MSTSTKTTNILVGEVGKKFNVWQSAISTLNEYEALKTAATTAKTNASALTSKAATAVTNATTLHTTIEGKLPVLSGLQDDTTQNAFETAYDSYDTLAKALPIILTLDSGEETATDTVTGKTGYTAAKAEQDTKISAYNLEKATVNTAASAYTAAGQAKYASDKTTWSQALNITLLDEEARENLHTALYYQKMLADNILRTDHIIAVIGTEITAQNTTVSDAKTAFQTVCPIYFSTAAAQALSYALEGVSSANDFIEQKIAEVETTTTSLTAEIPATPNA